MLDSLEKSKIVKQHQCFRLKRLKKSSFATAFSRMRKIIHIESPRPPRLKNVLVNFFTTIERMRQIN